MSARMFGIRNCESVKKARAWLDAHGVPYAFHDYKGSGVPHENLTRWCDRVGWEKLLNRSGTTFRKLLESDRASLDPKTAVELMLAQPSLIKRPVVETGGDLLVGFRPELYEATFSPGSQVPR